MTTNRPASNRPASNRPASNSPASNSVLIVDDNEIDVLIQQRHIERSGRFGQVYSATDGQAALDMYSDYQARRHDHPDDFPPLLVLLDINMPRIDGFEFLRRYRALELGLDPHFIVMVSSSDAKSDLDRATADPSVHHYMVKPLTRANVHELADQFLDA